MNPTQLENMFRYGNVAEAVVWFVFAARYGWQIRTAKAAMIRWMAFGALVFLLFGFSDLVEIQTGGWWKPWWLLLWKSLCILGIIIFAWKTRALKG